jgi:hypothetical protein
MNKQITNKNRAVLFYGFLLISLFTFSFLITFFSVESTVKTRELKLLEAWSGSIAPFGDSQLLHLDSTGAGYQLNSTYDSASGTRTDFVLTSSELNTLLDTIEAVGFFGLDSLYEDTLIADGSMISLGVIVNGDIYRVTAVNYSVDQINRIVKTLNTMISAYNIRIFYNDLN